MIREPDIPHGPMPLGFSLGGLLPQVGIYRRRGVFFQESSRSHLWLAAPFLMGGVVVIFLALGPHPKYVIAGFLFFTAACAAAPYFVRNRLGQTIIVDPGRRTICIKKPSDERTIAWSDLVALQLCRQDHPSRNYQLNLVWKSADGAYARYCLATHEVRRYVLALARRYESLLSLKLTDETHRGQPER
jgi:hypothetical protein